MAAGSVETAIRLTVQPGDRLATLAGHADFEIGELSEQSLVLLLGKQKTRTPLRWECLEGLLDFLGPGWTPIRSLYDTTPDPDTLDGYLKKRCIKRATGNYVAAVLETASLVEIDRGTPPRLRLLPWVEWPPEAVQASKHPPLWPPSGEPLFEPSPDELHLGDTKRAPGWFDYIESYRSAARSLTELANRNDTSLDFPHLAGIPVKFLYRHYLELLMKNLILACSEYLNVQMERAKPHMLDALSPEIRRLVDDSGLTITAPVPLADLARGGYGHDLSKLWKECRELVDLVWPGQEAQHAQHLQAVTDQVKELANVDQGSFSARYPVSKAGIELLPPERLPHYDLAKFSVRVERIGDLLAGAITGVGEELDRLPVSDAPST